MKYLPRNIFIQIMTGLGLLCLTSQPAAAAVLQNGWQYAIDVGYDSLAGDGAGGVRAGGTIYEAYGIAIKDDVENNTVWVGLNSNLPITGNPIPGGIATNGNLVPNENIGWGDLFIDFVDTTGGTGLKSASESSQLWGIRFADNNDSGVSELGLYSNVRAKSVVPINDGWSNLYNNNVFGVNPRQGLDAWMGDLRWNDDYYSAYNSAAGAWTDESSLMLSNIDSGTKVADITIRNQAELEEEGFDPDFFFEQGTEIFGFSFEKPLGFVGDFVATLLSECINDGMALLGNFVAPEPPPPPPPSEECPITISQFKALLPDEVEGGWKKFYDVASNKWYDPPPWLGFELVGKDGTLFTQIFDFPCGVSADNKFHVFVNDKKLGKFEPGDALNFLEVYDQPVESFKVVFEDLQNAGSPEQVPFSIQLEFNKELGDFWLRPLPEDEVPSVPEPHSIIGLLLSGLVAWRLQRRSATR